MDRLELAGLALALIACATTSVDAAPPDTAPRAHDRANDAFGLLQARRTMLELPANAYQPIVTNVPLDDEWVTLVLEPASVRSAAYRLLVQQADGSMLSVPPGPQRTYRGTLLERPGSVVSATLREDGLHARIASGTEEYWIQPARARMPDAPPGEHLSFNGADVVPIEGVCAATAPEAAGIDLAAPDDPLPPTAASTTLCVAELAVDVDSDFYASYGSIAAVEAQVNTVINAVNVQYERDVSITHEITTIIVRTPGSDPYTTTDAGALLGDFRSHWQANHADVPRDVAHLFTGKSLDGSIVGMAFVGAVCGSAAYGLSQADCCGSLACAADLVAHEIGHNWSAAHCSCSGYTMNPSLTCGGQFHPASSIPDILEFRDSLGCLSCGAAGPQACGDADAGDCQQPNGTPYCAEADCCGAVCAVDGFCCDTEWDQSCADLAAQLCGASGGPQDSAPVEAVPTNIQIKRGSLLGGGVPELMDSDNARVRVRSVMSSGRERTDVRITCSSPSATVSRLDLTVEVGGNLEGIDAFVYLRNFASSAWDRLERFDLPSSDGVQTYADVAGPQQYVNANGKVKVRVMTKIASGSYVARIDHVEVMVTP